MGDFILEHLLAYWQFKPQAGESLRGKSVFGIFFLAELFVLVRVHQRVHLVFIRQFDFDDPPIIIRATINLYQDKVQSF